MPASLCWRLPRGVWKPHPPCPALGRGHSPGKHPLFRCAGAALLCAFWFALGPLLPGLVVCCAKYQCLHVLLGGFLLLKVRYSVTLVTLISCVLPRGQLPRSFKLNKCVLTVSKTTKWFAMPSALAGPGGVGPGGAGRRPGCWRRNNPVRQRGKSCPALDSWGRGQAAGGDGRYF